MKLHHYLIKPLSFPVIFSILHVVTYGVFLGLANHEAPMQWHSYERSSLWNLILFYDTFWLNWCGLWVAYCVFKKRIKIFTGGVYLLAIFAEQYSIGWDYAEAYSDNPLTRANYHIMSSELIFGSYNHTVIHFSLYVAMAHFIGLVLINVFKKFYEKKKCLRKKRKSKSLRTYS